jgi:membrane-associated phospholipid phosphatase
MGAIALSVILTAFITHFWKISSHMVGIGGIIGFLFSVVLKTHNYSLEYPLLVGVVASGAVASSRLYLHAHNFLQIVAGFFLGMVISWSAVYFFV